MATEEMIHRMLIRLNVCIPLRYGSAIETTGKSKRMKTIGNSKL
jgi:hypothetical protein